MASPGRNELCSCGGGRKLKHCCLRALDAEDAARTRLRTAEGVLVPALFAYAADEFGDEFFAEAWEEFFLWDSVPDDLADSRECGTTFDPFFVFSFVPDPAEGDLPAGRPSRSRCGPATLSVHRSSSSRVHSCSTVGRRRFAPRLRVLDFTGGGRLGSVRVLYDHDVLLEHVERAIADACRR